MPCLPLAQGEDACLGHACLLWVRSQNVRRIGMVQTSHVLVDLSGALDTPCFARLTAGQIQALELAAMQYD